MNPSDKLLISLVFSSLMGLMSAQEPDSLRGLSSPGLKTLDEVVISANRYGSVQLKTPEAINLVDNKTIQKFLPNNTPQHSGLPPGYLFKRLIMAEVPLFCGD